MPLLKGKQNVGKNIKTEIAHGKPRKQAIAIALNYARKPSRNEKLMRMRERVQTG